MLDTEDSSYNKRNKKVEKNERGYATSHAQRYGGCDWSACAGKSFERTGHCCPTGRETLHLSVTTDGVKFRD